jgi:hypothetical protein
VIVVMSCQSELRHGRANGSIDSDFTFEPNKSADVADVISAISRLETRMMCCYQAIHMHKVIAFIIYATFSQ